eukprot:4118697-Amphidinium_carterae.1
MSGHALDECFRLAFDPFCASEAGKVYRPLSTSWDQPPATSKRLLQSCSTIAGPRRHRAPVTLTLGKTTETAHSLTSDSHQYDSAYNL